MIGFEKAALIGLGVIAGAASVASFGAGHRVSQEHGLPALVENHAAPVLGVRSASAAQSTAPATAAEPTAVLTADTDARQLRSGLVSGNSEATINGPLVLTDLVTDGITVAVNPAGSICSYDMAHRVLDIAHDVHIKIVIPSGSVACISASSQVTWAGYVPY